MVRTAVAFCPGHISGYFRQVEGETLSSTGSIGAGIVIDEGVCAAVTAADRPAIEARRVDADGSVMERFCDAAPLAFVMERLGCPASVVTECRLPISAGFGLSAAALLATLTALDAVYDLHLDEREVALLAHEAEIVHRTGLGDVAACRGGGVACRTGAGIDAPVARVLDIGGPIAAVSFGPLETSTVIGSALRMRAVDAAYPGRCPDGIEDFFALSRAFARDSGLVTDEVEEVLRACEREDVPASMTMLGRGVFAFGERAEAALAPFGEVYVMECATHGVRFAGGRG
ncbi:MAG: pantoate kinase [Methanomicrobiaceae archaeon]|nr:pantoate kinase [Methanomicrobiaceae archaeon]